MEWQTKVTVQPLPGRFSYATRFYFAGSCFASDIAQKMRELHFLVAPDAFGPLFNPSSIASSLERLEDPVPFGLAQVMKFPYGAYGSLDHHTSFSREDAGSFLAHTNDQLKEASDFFHTADFVVITFGTAWTYAHNGKVAANCHKLPARFFSRNFLAPEQVADLMAPLLQRHRDKTWIMTVSPIRHWADGAHGNQLSKASLHLAIDHIQSTFPNVYYFPSYELIMDELRDYRYYAADRCHLTEQTTEYILERFLETAADEETKAFVKKMQKLNASLAHRPLFPFSDQNALFLKKLEKQKTELLQAIGNKRKI
ncbi:MAG TPA: GSCFA domain protein, partial [Rikenellaceae bacterium]|nr:GSCFA domain protein [Rikenellaceae bacterium]